MLTTLPAPGQVVRVRAHRYLVEDVARPKDLAQQTLVSLSCLDDDAQGVPLTVLWEREVDAEVLGAASWNQVAKDGFDEPNLFSGYYHALRWNCVTSTDPRLFQAPYRAGIEVQAYQLEPLRKALQLPRVNLFIADDVGLGKTIEAGLIVRELLMRQKVKRILVACPASVVIQWRDEMERRFGLTFQVFDREFVAQRRRERGYGANPWTTHSRFIISHSLLRDECYAGPLRDSLGVLAAGSLLILDEAHNAAPASSTNYAIDSTFTRTIRGVAERFEHRLFLSATPHNGHSNSFSALLEILDPQRFCRGVPITNPKQLDEIMVRRLKGDLKDMQGGFPKRETIQVDIKDLPVNAPDLRLSQLLAEYAEARTERQKDASKRTRASAGLVITSLQRRLLSSIEAFACTLRVHRKTFERRLAQEMVAPVQVHSNQLALLAEAPGSDDDRADLPEADVGAEEEAQMEAATLAMPLAPAERLLLERRLLDQMTQIAEAARGLPDPKVEELIAWIRTNQCPGLPASGALAPGKSPEWNARRVILFTEYADTKRYLLQQLEASVAGTRMGSRRIAQFHGGMDDAAREDVKRAFNGDPALHPVRILVVTDAAREGLNLQNHCADLFHFDVPWNPSRIEQRNGRIDRKLQRETVVRCHYFIFVQRPEDRVLQVLMSKAETIQRELGSLSPVLEAHLATLLENGISRSKIDALSRAISETDAPTAERSTVTSELEDTRERNKDLEKQLERLSDILDRSKKSIGFSEPHFRNALSAALHIAGHEPLRRLEPAPDGGERWAFPALDELKDRSWAETLDTLRAPQRRDQKPWEWRREAPIRPLVFKDSGSLDEDLVHLHLEHRVAQRLLGRLLSQGFVHHDLSRAVVGQVGNIPRVVLLGRLSLYGDGASRLHDEILAVAAQWRDLDNRQEPLEPYAEGAEHRALDLLEQALAAAGRGAVDDVVRQKLLRSVSRDVNDLIGPMKERANLLASLAEARLADRGNREAKEMEAIIRAQSDRIGTQLTSSKARRLPLEFNEVERRQLELDIKHWQKRLDRMETDVATEPPRILQAYVVKVTRVEPVGIAYLWPISS